MKSLFLFTGIVLLMIVSCKKETFESPLANAGQPVADAGPDQIFIFTPTNIVTLNGDKSTDPDNNIISYAWTKIAGPSFFELSNANAIQAQAKNLVEGVYRFELKVTDASGLFDLDTMIVTVFLQSSTLTCVIPGSTQVASFLEPRVDMTSVVCNGKFYYSEGSVMDVFDPVSNSLNSTINLSMARAFVSGVSAGDKVFFAGGYTYSSTTIQPVAVSRVDIYNTTTGAFSITELSIPRYAISSCTIGNKVLFAGGSTDVYTESSRVDIYDISTNTWSHTELSQAGRFVSAIVNNKVWFVRHTSNQMDIYDPLTNSWSTTLLSSPVYSSLPAVIYNNAAITLNNKVYFTGCQTVRIYDIPSQSWSTITLNENKFFIPAAVSNGKIAFIGGMTSWFVYSSLIEIYDPATNSWSIQYMSSDLFYASFVSYNNYIYSAGGMINQENTSLSGICRFQL